jgi:hypothetical protein
LCLLCWRHVEAVKVLDNLGHLDCSPDCAATFDTTKPPAW